MTDLDALIAKVAELTGPDREVDDAVAQALCIESRFFGLKDAPPDVGCMMYRYSEFDNWESALRVTASLDATVALVERVLPGWGVSDLSNCTLDHKFYDVRKLLSWRAGLSLIGGKIEKLEDVNDIYVSATGLTPALALLSATLKALKATGGGGTMDRPVRVQLSRKKGWRMPENTVKVTRPGIYGNPWSIQACAAEMGLTVNSARVLVVQWFRRWVNLPNDHDEMQPFGAFEFERDGHARLHANLHHLRGKNLACWCRLGEPCHADVLLELANPVPAPSRETEG